MARTTKNWLLGGLLFTSLAFNLFLAGWLFGSGQLPPPPSNDRGAFFEAFTQKANALPEPGRTEVKKVLATHRPALRKQMRKIMKARDAIDTMFKRKDYSRAEAEERFATLQEQSITMQQMAQAMMLDLADAVPAEHRAAFMERPKEWRGKGAEFRHPPRKPGPPPAP